MRKITAGLFISLDGAVEAPDQWRFPYFNEEMGAAVDATLGAADTVLFGRVTYDSFAGAWPERELEILALVARGLSNQDIAAKLFISQATVKTHFTRVLSKLNLRDRAQAVVVAYETGLVQPGTP